MTAAQAIAVLIIRLWAVLGIILYLFAVSQATGTLFDGEELQANYPLEYILFATQSLGLAFWILILCYSRSLAALVLASGKDADEGIRVEPADAVRFGTVLIGVFYLTDSVPKLLLSVSRIIPQYGNVANTGEPAQIATFLFQLSAEIIPILISLWLILRPGDVVRFFDRLPGGGRRDGHEASSGAES